MAFIFIRHLPTAYNQQGLLQGKLDIPILPVDEKMTTSIECNLQQLKTLEPFSQVLCSPMIRTRQTAEVYGHLPTEEPLLRELDFGLYEGKNRQLMHQEIGDQWLNSPETLILGEPITELLARVQQFVHKYQKQGNILVFAHGAWMRTARAWYEQGSLDAMNRTLIANNTLLIIEPGNPHA